MRRRSYCWCNSMQVLECQSLSAMQALDSRSADQYTSWPHRFNSFSHSSSGKLRKISNSWFWRLRFLWALIRKSFDGFILFPLEVLFPIFSLTFYSHLRTKWPMTIFGIRFFMKKSAINVLLPTYLCLQNWAINYRFLSGPGNYWPPEQLQSAAYTEERGTMSLFFETACFWEVHWYVLV